MREIKFRAWNKEKKCFIHHDTMNIKLCDINNRNYKELLVFQEYTGLKDKNGVEIYEGDIIKTCEGRKQVVVWENNGFKLKYTFSKTYQGEKYKETVYLELVNTSSQRWGDEVIGNIYENKDLLEEVK